MLISERVKEEGRIRRDKQANLATYHYLSEEAVGQ
jgi:hypothetical protein